MYRTSGKRAHVQLALVALGASTAALVAATGARPRPAPVAAARAVFCCGTLVQSLAWSPDGALLASGCAGSGPGPRPPAGEALSPVYLWDARAGRLRRTLCAHRAGVAAAAFSADGAALVTACRRDVVRWDVRTGRLLCRRLRAETGRALACAVDGQVAVGDGTGQPTLEQAAGGRRRLPATDGGALWTMAFSPDGAALASVSGEQLRVWNVRTGALLAAECGSLDRFWSVALSRGGLLAAGGEHGTVALWAPGALPPRGGVAAAARPQSAPRRFAGHRGPVSAVAISPDGRTLASASLERVDSIEWAEIRLWDVCTGTLRGRLLGHEGTISALAFSPDGRSLASGSSDSTVRLWRVD
jgi:WD40 repeat protein